MWNWGGPEPLAYPVISANAIIHGVAVLLLSLISTYGYLHTAVVLFASTLGRRRKFPNLN